MERPFEQIKDDFCYQRLGGNIISTGASYDYGTDGMTHYGMGDVPILRTLPGMEVVVPGTPGEFDALFREAYADGAPTYFRLAEQQNRTDRAVRFGRLEVVRRGSAATVVAVGPMLDRVLEAVANLDVTVLYCTTVAPFDGEALRAETSAGHRAVVVVEPYYEGTLVPEIVAALRPDPVRIEAIGVPRRVLTRYGSVDEHDAELGLSAPGIRRRIEDFLAEALGTPPREPQEAADHDDAERHGADEQHRRELVGVGLRRVARQGRRRGHAHAERRQRLAEHGLDV